MLKDRAIALFTLGKGEDDTESPEDLRNPKRELGIGSIPRSRFGLPDQLKLNNAIALANRR